MQIQINRNHFHYPFGPMERLQRDGCGLINCRPRRRPGQSVHSEIQAVIDARSGPAGRLDGSSAFERGNQTGRHKREKTVDKKFLSL